jgi:hypothetical protein
MFYYFDVSFYTLNFLKVQPYIFSCEKIEVQRKEATYPMSSNWLVTAFRNTDSSLLHFCLFTVSSHYSALICLPTYSRINISGNDNTNIVKPFEIS